MQTPSVTSDLFVVETASVLAGPLVGQFFAELGAQVIKIENPTTGGDITRQWLLEAEDQDQSRSAYFCAVNWGKSSIALDLRQSRAKEVFFELLSRADVWVDNFPANALHRMGIDEAEILIRFPRLIHAKISAYSTADPRPGYDAALQAETGLMAMNGDNQSGPLKLPLAMVDILAAHQLKQGVLLALWQRERSGKGQQVCVSLYDAAVTALANQASNFLVAGVVAKRHGSSHPNIVPYGTVFECEHGEPVVLAIGSDKQFAAFCDVLKRPDIAENSRFCSNSQRVVYRGELDKLISDLLAVHSRQWLLQELSAHGVPASPVNDIKEVLNSRAAAPLLFAGATDSTMGKGLRTLAFSLQDGNIESLDLDEPPLLDQHAEDVLEPLGYSREWLQSES